MIKFSLIFLIYCVTCIHSVCEFCNTGKASQVSGCTEGSSPTTQPALAQNLLIIDRSCNSSLGTQEVYIPRVNLTGLAVTWYNQSYQLLAEWSLHYDVPGSLLITVARGSHTSKTCAVYTLREGSLTGYLSDRCLQELTPSESYQISLTQLSRTYYIFTPDSLSSNSEHTPYSEWRTLVGVTVDPKLITLYLQPIPSSGFFYIQLIYSKGQAVVLEDSIYKWIKKGQTPLVFENPGEREYLIKLSRCELKSYPDSCVDIQSHRLIASVNHLTISYSDTTAMDSSPEVHIETDKEGLNELTVILAAVFGLVVFIAAIVVIGLICCHRRNQSGSHVSAPRFSDINGYGDGLFIEDDMKEQAPSLLLLYSYDCQPHLACVQALAQILQNDLGCVVYTDFWATQDIAEQGIRRWLERRLNSADYVIVVCSTGVRFKSASRRQTVTDDVFVTALNILHQELASSDLDRRLAIYFDYSSECDIPPSLEKWQRCQLPRDMDLLVSTIIDTNLKELSTDGSKPKLKLGELNELTEKIDQAKRYMSENPDWFHCNLDPTDSSNVKQSLIGPKALPIQPIDVVTIEPEPNKKMSPHKLTPSLGSLSKGFASSLERGTKFATLSSLSSQSSGQDDLEYDVDFMLNPTLTTRQKYFPSSNGFQELCTMSSLDDCCFPQQKTGSNDSGVGIVEHPQGQMV